MTPLAPWQREILAEGIRLYRVIVDQFDRNGPTVKGMPNGTTRDKLDRWCAGSVFERESIADVRELLDSMQRRLARG